ncbi:MAG: acetylhydrolase [Burkholderiales bacterium]|nr:acetylhydrolase [Burkholderiales bacterium]
MTLSRRHVLLAGAAGSAALLLGACSARGPGTDRRALDDARTARDAGQLVAGDGFTQVELDWTDPARGRAVPVRLYLPAAQASGAPPLALVLFSHGLGGSRRGYSYLGTHLARHGIACLHVQHVGSDRALWGGSPLELAARLQAAAQDREAIDRVADLSFALDRVLEAGRDDAWRFAVDPARVIVAGHSYGANTALLASGAQVERDGAAVNLHDRRVRAAIVLSAPPFYGAPALAPILRPVTLPSLHVTTTDDEIRVPGYWSPPADRVRVFDAIGSRPKALAVFNGGAHSVFTDRTLPGGPELNARVKAATQQLTLAFMASTFDGRAEALGSWSRQHGEILARFTATA